MNQLSDSLGCVFSAGVESPGHRLHGDGRRLPTIPAQPQHWSNWAVNLGAQNLQHQQSCSQSEAESSQDAGPASYWQQGVLVDWWWTDVPVWTGVQQPAFC